MTALFSWTRHSTLTVPFSSQITEMLAVRLLTTRLASSPEGVSIIGSYYMASSRGQDESNPAL